MCKRLLANVSVSLVLLLTALLMLGALGAALAFEEPIPPPEESTHPGQAPSHANIPSHAGPPAHAKGNR